MQNKKQGVNLYTCIYGAREKCPGGVLLEGGLFLEEVLYVETEIGMSCLKRSW